ncbi:MAG: leucine-rich repeat domain-containing protein [Clostridiales bacterium]|nr:leucine-rich repeat domain-containing protein [Clostridiales bacterium]
MKNALLKILSLTAIIFTVCFVCACNGGGSLDHTCSFTDYVYTGDGIDTAFCDYGCGKTDTKSSETFIVNKEGDTIVGLTDYGKTLKKVVIPEEINGKVIKFIGEKAFYENNNIEELVVSKKVEKIGELAFSYCSNLEKVVLGENLKILENSVFYCSQKIQKVTLGDKIEEIGDYAFDPYAPITYNIKDGLKYLGTDENKYLYLIGRENSAITNITIDEQCKVIGGGAFNYSLLQEIVIPNNVKSIGKNAFYSVSSLKKVVISDSVEKIGEQAFAYCTSLEEITLGNGLKEIGKNAFTTLTSLKEITLPNSLEKIDDYAFMFCTSLEKVVMGDGLKEIGQAIFSGCNNLVYNQKDGLNYLGTNESHYLYLIGTDNKNLSSVVIDSSCKVIAGLAFDGNSLKQVEIPASVESIGEMVFNDCSWLQNIKVDENNGYYKDVDGNLFTKDGKTFIVHPKGKKESTLTIPNGVEVIKERAFYENKELTKIELPDSVKVIKEYAFSGCFKLEEVKLSKNLEIIENNSFHSCTSLQKIVIPDGVEIIEDYAFAFCDLLKEVTIGSSVKEIGYWAFAKCNRMLKEITIPNSVKIIGSGAFWECTALREISIGRGVKEISNDTFYLCSSLSKIEVDENNRYYKDIDGNLYTKDGKTLIKYAMGKTETAFTVPDGVEIIETNAFYKTTLKSVTISNSVKEIKENAFNESEIESLIIGNGVEIIGHGAFIDCRNLESVVIPDSVKTISNWAFGSCVSLESVVIGSGVTYIGNSFIECSNLKDISYNGTLKEWESINRGGRWDGVIATFVKCTDGNANI